MDVTRVEQANFPADGEAQILADLLARGQSLVSGEEVVAFQFVQSVEVEGILSLAITVGLSASPIGASVPLTIRQRGDVDSSRINFI